MDFEWDAVKAAFNIEKHGVSFTEAMTLFGDPLETAIPDPDHSPEEFRFLSIGRSAPGRVLVVAYTEREGRLRLIGARPARPLSGDDMSQGSTTNPDDMRPDTISPLACAESIRNTTRREPT